MNSTTDSSTDSKTDSNAENKTDKKQKQKTKRPEMRTDTVYDKVTDALDALEKEEADSEITDKQIIERMAERIMKLKDAGIPYRRIHAALQASAEIKLSTTSMITYVQKIQAKLHPEQKRIRSGFKTIETRIPVELVSRIEELIEHIKNAKENISCAGFAPGSTQHAWRITFTASTESPKNQDGTKQNPEAEKSEKLSGSIPGQTPGLKPESEADRSAQVLGSTSGSVPGSEHMTANNSTTTQAQQ